jgi:hypothetical protein
MRHLYSIKNVIVLNLCLAALLLAGCVERYLVIRAPEGTQVWLDGRKVDKKLLVKEKARTEYRIPFTYYGTREVVLRKYGCKSLAKKVALSAPFYQWFPIDAVFDLLIPFTITDNHVHEFTLEKIGEVKTEELLERAAEMRKRANE